MTKLSSSFEYTNTDGSHLVLRWVRPEDKELIADGVKLMSVEGLYLRFFMQIKKLSDQQLDYLTSADQIDHIAWGVLDENCPEFPGLGIARFVREPGNPKIAEAAVTVLDSYQGQGIGTLLLAVLHHSARVNGIEILRSIVLIENSALIKSLKKLGGKSHSADGNTIKIDLPVYKDLSELSDENISPIYKKYLLDLNELMFE